MQTVSDSRTSKFAHPALRGLAFLADAIIVAVMASFVAYQLPADLTIGQDGRFVGFAFILLYFGVLSSRWGGGRTLGMRLCGLRVVDADGLPIGLWRSLLRTSWIALYFTIYGFDLRRFVDLSNIQELNRIISSFIEFGILLPSLYLAFANLRTRQLVHDIFAGTYVVRGAVVAPVKNALWEGHLYVILLGAVLGLAVPYVPFSWIDSLQAGKKFTLPYKLETALANDKNFVVTSYQRSGFQTLGLREFHNREVITFGVWLHAGKRQPRHVAQKICQALKRIEPGILKDRTLVIEIKTGTDFGIAGKGRHSIAIVGPAELPGFDERGIDFDALPGEMQDFLNDDSERYLPGLRTPQDELMQRMGSCEF